MAGRQGFLAGVKAFFQKMSRPVDITYGCGSGYPVWL